MIKRKLLIEWKRGIAFCMAWMLAMSSMPVYASQTDSKVATEQVADMDTEYLGENAYLTSATVSEDTVDNTEGTDQEGENDQSTDEITEENPTESEENTETTDENPDSSEENNDEETTESEENTESEETDDEESDDLKIKTEDEDKVKATTPTITLRSVFSDSSQSASNYTLKATGNDHSLEVGFTKGDLQKPVLEIVIPDGMTNIKAPDQNTVGAPTTFKESLVNMTETPGADGKTTIRYEFNERASDFTISILFDGDIKKCLNNIYKETVVNLYDDTVLKKTAKETLHIYNASLQAEVFYFSGPSFEKLYSGDDMIVSPSTYLYCRMSSGYPYDKLVFVMPSPQKAETGYLDAGGNFQKFTNGQSITLKNYRGEAIGKATFYSSYTGCTNGALVYEYSGDHDVCKGSYSVQVPGNSQNGNIRYKFTGAVISGAMSNDVAAFTQSFNCKATAYVNGTGYEVGTTSNYTGKYYFTQMELKKVLYPGVSSYPAYPAKNSGGVTWRIYNDSEYEANNVKTKLEIPSEVAVQKMSVYVESGMTVTVEYTLNSGETKTATVSGTVSAVRKDIEIADNKKITAITATYDKVPARKYQSISLYDCNTSGAVNRVFFKASILGGKTTPQLAGNTTGLFGQLDNADSYYQELYTAYPLIFQANSYSDSYIQCGVEKQFSYRIQGQRGIDLCSPTLYFMMPEGYEITNITPPSGWSGPTITRSKKVLNTSKRVYGYGGYEDIPAGSYDFYTVKHSGNYDMTSSSLTYSLTVKLKFGAPSQVYLPNLYAGIIPEGTNYRPYAGIYYDDLDVDGDGNTSESVAQTVSVKQIIVQRITGLEAGANVSDASGSVWKQQVTMESREDAKYKVTLFNGQESTDEITDIDVIIPLPKKGTVHTYQGNNYTDQWDAELTGEAELAGSVFEGASVTYSYDGGSSYGAYNDAQKGNITHVRVKSAAGKILPESQSLEVVIPIKAVLKKASVFGAQSFMTSEINYKYLDMDRNITTDLCTLTAGAPAFTGVIFEDFNNNSVRDLLENHNVKEHSATLYSGAYTSGLAGLTQMQAVTSEENGDFSFENIITTTGNYTVKVTKRDDEFFKIPAGENWTVVDNDAFFTFELVSNGEMPTANIGLLIPREMTVTGAENNDIIYAGESRSLTTEVVPALLSDENVTYQSSDETVLKVDENGNLIYVSDGDATITVTIPKYATLGTGGGTVTKEIALSTLRSSYEVILHGNGGTLDDLTYYTETGSGVYSRSYSKGHGFTLPVKADLTAANAGDEFVGWYTKENGQGSLVTEISDTDHDDFTFYAYWEHYPIRYQDMNDEWVNTDSLSVAAANVKQNGKIQILEDIDLIENVTFMHVCVLESNGQSVTVHQNGYSLVMGANAEVTLDDANVTLQYGQANADSISVSGNLVNVIVREEGSLTLGDSIISGAGYAVAVAGAIQMKDAPALNGSRADIYLDEDSVISFAGMLSNSRAYTVYKQGAENGKTIISGEYSDDFSEKFTSVQNGFTVSYGRDTKLHLRQDIVVCPVPNQGKVWGEQDPVLAYTLNPNHISVSGNMARVAGEMVGTYAYTLGTLAVEPSAFDDYRLVLSSESDLFTIERLIILHKVKYTVDQDVMGQVPAMREYEEHEVFTIADANLTKEEYAFVGWEYNGQVYQPGTQMALPENDVTFVAKWEHMPVRYEDENDRWVNTREISEAVAHVKANGRIQLLEDVALEDDLIIHKPCTLETNGNARVLYQAGHGIMIGAGADVTIEDSNLSIQYLSQRGIRFSGSVSSCGICVEQAGKLKLGSANISGKDLGIVAKGKLVMTGLPQISGLAADIYLGADSEITVGEPFVGSTIYKVYKEDADQGKTIIVDANVTDYSARFRCVQPGFDVNYGRDTKLHLRQDIVVLPIQNQGKVQGENDPVIAYETIPAGKVLVGRLSRVAGEEIGEYAYTLGTLTVPQDQADDFRLILSDQSDTFKVDKKMIKHKVSYVVDADVKGEVPQTVEYEVHQVFTIPEVTLSKEGYTFLGWQYSEKLYKAGDQIAMPDEDVTFVAKWNKNPEPEQKPKKPKKKTKKKNELPVTLASVPNAVPINRVLDPVPKTGDSPVQEMPVWQIADMIQPRREDESE